MAEKYIFKYKTGRSVEKFLSEKELQETFQFHKDSIAYIFKGKSEELIYDAEKGFLKVPDAKKGNEKKSLDEKINNAVSRTDRNDSVSKQVSRDFEIG